MSIQGGSDGHANRQSTALVVGATELLTSFEGVTTLALAVAGGRESRLIFPWALFACPAFQLQAASNAHAQAAATNVERIEPS